MPPRRSVGGRKPYGTRKPPIGGTLPKKEQRSGTLYLHCLTVEVQRPLCIKAIRVHRSRVVLPPSADSLRPKLHAPCVFSEPPIQQRPIQSSRTAQGRQRRERRSGRCFRIPHAAAEKPQRDWAAQWCRRHRRLGEVSHPPQAPSWRRAAERLCWCCS